MEDEWTWNYFDKLPDFVYTINSRFNRVTNLAPNKFSKKHKPFLISLDNEQSTSFLRLPNLRIGDFVRIAKPDLPFRKGYKQNFTDEVFTVEKVNTLNPPTYTLIDANDEKISANFTSRN